MTECRYCHYRFDTPAALVDHLEYVIQFDPVLCSNEKV